MIVSILTVPGPDSYLNQPQSIAKIKHTEQIINANEQTSMITRHKYKNTIEGEGGLFGGTIAVGVVECSVV